MNLLLVAASSMIILALAEKQGELTDHSKHDYMTAKEIEELQLNLAAQKHEAFLMLDLLETSAHAELDEPTIHFNRKEAQCLLEVSDIGIKAQKAAYINEKGPFERMLKSGHPIKKSKFLAQLEAVDKSLDDYRRLWFEIMRFANDYECKDKSRIDKGK